VLAEVVSERVYAPRDVEDPTVSQGTRDPVSVPEVIAPQGADETREDEAHKELNPGVALALEDNHGVLSEVLVVELLAGSDHGGVLLDKEPPDVGKEQAASGVVRVAIGLRVFMVSPMVSGPVVDGSLVGHRVAKHQEDAEGQTGLIRAMSPETMSSCGDSETTVRGK
jgi:hypothetical protein